MLPGRAGEEVAGLEEVVVDIQRRAVPVDDGLGGDGGAEAMGLADDPGGENAAAAAARDEQVMIIDVAALEHLVHAGHEVIVIVAGIIMVDELGKGLAVTG